LLSSAAVRYQPRFGQDKHHWAFVCYLLLLYLYSSAVGVGHSNEFPACSNTRPLGTINMGQIIHPDSYDYKGPWLLGRADFVELEKIISTADELLQKAFEIEVAETVKSENGNLNDQELQEKITKAKSRYPYDKKNKVAYFKAKNETKLAGNTLNDILKDKNINSFSPKEFHSTIQYGNNIKFTIHINRFGNRLGYELNCLDTSINDEIKDSIEQWIEKNKPNVYVSFWSNWGDLLTFILPMIIPVLGFFAFTSFESSSSDLAKSEAISIIKKGVDSSNVHQALETILKLEANYKPDNFAPSIQKPNPIYLKLFVFFLFLYITALIRPRTIIGVGQRKKILGFYKFWIKFVTITIPTLLIISPFLRKIQEWWTS